MFSAGGATGSLQPTDPGFRFLQAWNWARCASSACSSPPIRSSVLDADCSIAVTSSRAELASRTANATLPVSTAKTVDIRIYPIPRLRRADSTTAIGSSSDALVTCYLPLSGDDEALVTSSEVLHPDDERGTPRYLPTFASSQPSHSSNHDLPTLLCAVQPAL